MASLDRIASVQISLNTTAIKEQSFSDLLILGPHALSVGRTLIVTEADQLLDLGMLPTDPIYLAAQDVFSQIPTVTRLFIGRQQVNAVPLTITAAVQGATYSAKLTWRDVNGVVQTATASYVAASGNTTGQIATALSSAIAGSGAPVTPTVAASVITVTTNIAGAAFGITTAGNISRVAGTSTELPGVALAAAKVENNDWYGVSITARDNASVLSAADWVEANKKLLGVSISADNALDPAVTTDLGSLLKQGQYFRTHWWYHKGASLEWLEAAVAAKSFTYYPGGETWALKRLAGIAYDDLQEGQAQAVFAKNGNTFEQFRNFATTQNGRVAAGEWIDVIRFRDWLEEEIKINVVSAMINADGKLPYTDAGIQVIVAAMRQALDRGVTRKGIAPEEVDPTSDRVIPSYTVSAPSASAVSFNDKANRILRDVKFTARLAGAIHVTEIKGSLSYSI
jgi:hypothetical protein